MTPPPKYVTETVCNAKHGKTKGRLTLLTTLVVAAILVPCAAGGVAWSAWSKAASVGTKHDAQAEFLHTTLSEIQRDVREIRQVQTQMLRNGDGG